MWNDCSWSSLAWTSFMDSQEAGKTTRSSPMAQDHRARTPAHELLLTKKGEFIKTDLSSKRQSSLKEVTWFGVGDDFFAVLFANGELKVSGSINLARPSAIWRVFAQFNFLALIILTDEVQVLFSGQQSPQTLDLPIDCSPSYVYNMGPTGACVLSADGRLFAFPDISAKPSHVYEKVVSVASSRQRTFILKSDGRIFQLVDHMPIQFFGIDVLPIRLFAGGSHFGCVTQEGTAFTWATERSGRGNGGVVSFLPTKVVNPSGKKIVDAVAGDLYTTFYCVEEHEFAAAVPGLMLGERFPAAIAAMSRRSEVRLAELDMKF
jgi:hypothetical protein